MVHPANPERSWLRAVWQSGEKASWNLGRLKVLNGRRLLLAWKGEQRSKKKGV
jgi:hypothetical protein